MRLGSASLLFGAVVLAVAGGASAASAEVHPALAAPGTPLRLVYVVDGPAVAEVAVQERHACTLTAPDGTVTEPCDHAGALVEVRAVGGARAYVFELEAPATAGEYGVEFRTESAATVPPAATGATARFVVEEAPSGDPDDPLADRDLGGVPTGGGDPVDPNALAPTRHGAAGNADAERWIVSSGAAAAALTALFAAARFPS